MAHTHAHNGLLCGIKVFFFFSFAIARKILVLFAVCMHCELMCKYILTVLLLHQGCTKHKLII